MVSKLYLHYRESLKSHYCMMIFTCIRKFLSLVLLVSLIVVAYVLSDINRSGSRRSMYAAPKCLSDNELKSPV